MKKSELRKIIRECIHKINEAKGVPSNIEEFAKNNGCLAQVKNIANWLIKLGRHGISGGTAIGKGYGTLVLDILYQDAAIYYYIDRDIITIYGKEVKDFKSFKAAYDEHNKK